MSSPGTNPTPKVSVIIPSYKTAHLIRTCLDSVLAQTYADFEAIVVNDGSPDTPELEAALGPYFNRIVYLKQENKRAAGARNHAIGKARGEYIAFLDSDDAWLPNHLASQMKLFVEDPSLGLVYANALLVGDPDHEQEFMDRCPSTGQADFDALLAERCQIPISTVVAKRQLLIDAGLFDESLPRCDDYDLWVRALFHGAKVKYNRAVQARLLIGRPGSLGQSRSKMVEAYWSILEKFKRTLPLNEKQRAAVNARAEEVKALYLLEEGKCRLAEHRFEEARTLIEDANSHLRRSMLTLAVLGLRFAPGATGRFMTFWNRARNAT